MSTWDEGPETDSAPDEPGPTGIGHINASAAYTGGGTPQSPLHPKQFQDPFRQEQDKLAPGTPRWAQTATNMLNKYEGARAFSRPGGLTRALKYTLSGDPGISRGVRESEVGEVLGRGGGLSEGSQAEDVGAGVVD